MKHKFGFVKRGIALVSAMAMLASGLQFGGLSRVQASKPLKTYRSGQALADTYSEFSETERELLRMLDAGPVWQCREPDASDDLVAIDTEERTITAVPYTDSGVTWTAVSAALYNRDGDKLEDLRIVSGTGSYTYEDSAFTAEVTYQLDEDLPVSDQEWVVDALQALAYGKQSADSILSSADSLDMVVTVMDILDMLSKGISYPLGGGVMVTLQFQEEARKAVDALNKQYKANGGRLDLQLHNEAYTAGAAMEYLSVHGQKYQEVAAQTHGYLKAIAEDDALNMSFIDSYISQNQPGLATAWKTLKTDINKAVKALTPATENWVMLERDYIPAELTSDEYIKLDSLVDGLNKQQSITGTDDITYTETVTLASAVVSCNASVVQAQLKVELQTYDAANVPTFVTRTSAMKLAEGDTLAQLEAEAEAFEAQVAEQLKTQGYDIVNDYERNVTTDAPEILEGVEQVSYTVTYVPKNCEVTFAYSGQSQSLPIGWHITLESYPDSTKVYEYEIDGTYYPQGTDYTVSHSVVIDRKAWKPAVQTDLLSVIADAYGTDKEAAILTSGALLGNHALSIRWPDNEDGKLIISEDGMLKVSPYSSGYNGLQWQPYSYTVSGEKLYFDGKDTVSVTASGVDTIPVTYRLALKDVTAAQVQTWLDTASDMANDAAAQTAALEKLNAQYNGMGQITKAILSILKNSIYETELHEDWATNEELQDYLVAVVDNIIKDCIEKNGKLRLYNMLTEYRKSGTGGLVYYYRNSEVFIAEVELLSGYLNDMLADELKINAVKILMESMGHAEYADRFTELESIMNEVSASLTPPNPAINVSSSRLDVLVSALTMTGTTGTTGAGQLFLEETFQVAAPNKSAVQITVAVGDRVIGTVSVTYELEEGHVLTQADVDGFRGQLADIVKANLDSKYYTESFDVELDSLVGRVMDSSITVKNTWTPRSYTVFIEGMDSQTITVENMAVTLPEPPIGFRYDYLVDGVIREAGTYRFTTEQLDRLFTDGSYTVTVDRVNVAAERLLTFLGELNEAGGDVMRFSLNDAQDTVTVEVAAGDKAALNKRMQNVVLAMLGGYSYMGLNNEPMLYTTEKDTVEVSLQAIYDAVLHDSSFTHQTIIDLRDGEGRLTTTTLQLGDSRESLEQDLKFEIFLTSAPSELVSMGNYLARAENNMTFQANEGVLDVELNLTEDMYQQLLSGMLMTGRVKLDQLNDVTSGAAAHFLLSNVKEMVSDENVTMTTYENTLAMLGQESDLAGDQTYYEYLAGILRTAVFTQQENGCGMLQTVDIKKDLDETVGDDPAAASVLGMIKEYNTDGVKVDMYVFVTNTADYTAVVMDDEIRFLSGLENTENLSGTLVLLKAWERSELVLPDGMVLDLNGNDVLGDIRALGSLAIVDSRHASGAAGRVSGEVTGDVTVYGGSFEADVSEFVAEGLLQIGKEVRDERFRVETDENGDLIYRINWDADRHSSQLAQDILADILVNTMGIGAMDMDGNALYDLARKSLMQQGARAVVQEKDLLWNILANADAEGLAALMEALWLAPMNFEAAAKGEALGQYTFTLYPWDVSYEHVPEGDYLDVALVTGQQTRQVTVTLIYDENSDNLQAEAAALAKLFRVSGVDVRVELTAEEDGQSIGLKVTAEDLTWALDLTEDKNYSVMLAVIAACGDPENRAALAEAVNSGNDGALRSALEAMSLSQLLQALSNIPEDMTLEAMAEQAGITVDISAAAALEAPLHGSLVRLARELKLWTLPESGEPIASFADPETEGTYLVEGPELSRTDAHILGNTAITANMTVNSSATLKLFRVSWIFEVLDAAGKTLVGTDDAAEALAALQSGCTLQINRPAENVSFRKEIGFSVKLVGAGNLSGSYYFLLLDGVQLQSDAKVNVASAANGYVVACEERNGSYVYSLTAVKAPVISGSNAAEIWTSEENGSIRLFMDVTPKGMTLSELKKSLSFSDLEALGQTVEVSVSGNDGTGLVKTGDTLTISVKDGSMTLAEISYDLVVAGDVNRDGKITSSDAVAMMTMFFDGPAAFSASQQKAADANKDGKITSSDAVRIMTKFMDWESYRLAVAGK